MGYECYVAINRTMPRALPPPQLSTPLRLPRSNAARRQPAGIAPLRHVPLAPIPP